MTTTEYTPTRKTTDVVINGEVWEPIRAWLLRCYEADPTQKAPFLFVDHDVEPALNQFLRRTEKLNNRQDLRMRLPHQNLEAFGMQMRFWESEKVELARKFRDHIPKSGYFQSAAFEIEGAIDEMYRPPQSKRVYLCCQCSQPVTQGGHAEIDLDMVRVWHDHCPTNQSDSS